MPGTIKYLDLTLPSPEENLALDEALLDACDAGGDQVLRCWESPRHFVVVGLGRAVAEDVRQAACAANGVPILRRCSGGGTVLQGPGCLNYALVLRLEDEAELQTVSGTNRFIMERNRAALASVTNLNIRIEGVTDLAVDGLKFSGNAQRRKRHALLFHGTILLDFDRAQVDRFIGQPNLQPEYRRARTHLEFLRTLELKSEAVRGALKNTWQARSPLLTFPMETVGLLANEKYSRAEWNLRK